MRCSEVITLGKLCQICGNPIEGGRFRNRPATDTKYCLKCRSDRRSLRAEYSRRNAKKARDNKGHWWRGIHCRR